jgi:hypothetical protein
MRRGRFRGRRFPASKQQRDAAVAILNVSRRHQRLQQETSHVDQNMALFSLYQFACVEAQGVDARPLLTLWLSTMQAVGLASRSSFSRHLI